MAAINILKTFVLFQIAFATVQAAGTQLAETDATQLNITTSLQDYIAQLERYYSGIISQDEAAVAELRASYERQLATVDAQRAFVEIELGTVGARLYTLQFLNELSKHCVQKYQGLLYATSAVRQNFASCISQARSNLNNILSTADSNVRSLNNLFNSNFKTGITNCERQNASYDNHTICVLNFNNGFSVSFNNIHRAFLNNFDAAKCSVDTRIRLTVECVFKTVNASISSIGSTTSAIDSCIQALELCEPCTNPNGNNNTSIVDPNLYCPNYMNVTIGTNDLTHNATIQNPLFGLNNNLTCLLVNFIREN